MEVTDSGHVHITGHSEVEEESPFLPCRPDHKPFPYHHLPLDGASIRLLRMISTNKRPHRIACSIHHVRLDSPRRPNYTTLSYAWGDSFPDGSHLTEVLPCDGGYIRITKNLRRALLSIFDNQSDGLIFLWADAICINQANIAERNGQVKLMPKIYSNCDNLVVWLGELSESALEWLSTISSGFPDVVRYSRPRFTACPAWSLSKESPFESLSCVSVQRKSSLPLSYQRLLENPPAELEVAWVSNIREALGFSASTIPLTELTQRVAAIKQSEKQSHAELMRRPWFHRKWVIQEMAHTSQKRRTFLIGDHVKAFAEVNEAVSACAPHGITTPLSAKSLGKNLLQNLVAYRNSQCSDPRDHVYALLGISRDKDEFNLDYAIGVEELYHKIAKHYMGGNYMDCMILATATKSSSDLPSWVPDWRKPWGKARSAMHTQLLELTASPNLQLGNLTDEYRHGIPRDFKLEAWMIERCFSCGPDILHVCTMCTLLRGRPSYRKTWSTQRRTESEEGRREWLATIQEQVKCNMRSEEVLCILENWAVAFVVSPVVDAGEVQNHPAYRLEFCFQIDDVESDWGGWAGRTRWFSYFLQGHEQQSVYIV